jgi:hypothetical protein
MSTTQANLEPIFLLYNGDHGTATTLVDEVAATRPPLITAHTEDGLTHRLWAITDQAEIDAINADLHPRQALIADGHHRYATYRVLQRQQHLTHAAAVSPRSVTAHPTAADRTATPTSEHAPGPKATPRTDTPAPGTRTDAPGHELHTDTRRPGPSQLESNPWDFGLALLVDSATYAPNLQAIHRVIPDLPLEEAVARATITRTSNMAWPPSPPLTSPSSCWPAKEASTSSPTLIPYSSPSPCPLTAPTDGTR